VGKWGVIGAADCGAPHKRDRLWIVAHADHHGLQERMHESEAGPGAHGGKQVRSAADRIPASSDAPNANDWKRSLGRQIGRVGRIGESVSRVRGWPLTSEPVLGRGADGVAHRLDRLKAIGNGQCSPVVARAWGQLAA
jgi:DNA (cytosine-5)-methyltransferase 1